MTVHMFRCFIGRGPMGLANLETSLADWVDANGEWVDDPAAHTLSEHNTATDGSGTTYHALDVRFLPDNSKANLQQKFTDKLENKVGWYKIGYHACTHRDDGDSSGPCSWDDVTEWAAKDVTIPDGVPTLNPPNG